MARLTSELFVRLLDGVTKPAQGIARAFNGIGQSVTRLNGAGAIGQNLANAAANTQTKLDNMTGRMFGAVAAGYALQRALTAPINSAVEFSTILEDMGQKADIPREKLGALGNEIRQVAADTNQSAMDIATAVDSLLGMGATEEVALAAAAPIGQAATAYNAASEDLAAASFAAVQNLGIASSEIGNAIDIMAFAGKAGAFELKDMAQYMPGLGASYQRLGQTGVEAVGDLSAALQIVRRGTGDSASAATNLNNVLQKVFAPATVNAFKKQGVDIFEEMAEAAEKGLDPIEAIAMITEDTLDGDMSKLGSLFQDAQVQAGITSLILGLEDYQRIRDESMKSEGTVSADYQRRMQDNAMVTKRWQIAMENLNLTVGNALLPALSDLADKIIPIMQGIGDWIDANPELTSGLVTAAAGLVAFNVALTAARWAGLFTMAGALRGLAGGFLAVGKASTAAKSAIALQTALAGGGSYTKVQKLGTAISAMARVVPGLGLIGPAFTAVGTAIATIGAGGVAIVAGIAAAGLMIWKYWDRLTAIFSGVGQVISDMIPDFEITVPYAEKFAKLGDDIGAAWNKMGEDLRWIGEAIGGLFSQEVLTEDEKAKIKQATIDYFNGVLDVAKAIPGQIVDFFKGLGSQILNAIGSIDIGSLVRLPKFPWDGTPESGETVSTPKGNLTMFAKGGPIRKGETGIVGDGGEPEFFTAGADGYITPFSEAGSGTAPRRSSAPTTFAPKLVIEGNVYGVDDLEARFEAFMARLRSEYDSKMAGGFSDAEIS